MAASATTRTSLGMNRMIGTDAGLSVQTEGTMVRLPNQRSADRLPKLFLSLSSFFFLSASIDSTRHRSSLRHTYISSERNFSSHFSMASGGILSTLAFQKPSACSTEPACTPGPVDPMMLPETEAARDTNCARDVERTHASRGLLFPPYHPLRLHLRWRPRRSLARRDTFLLPSRASPGPQSHRDQTSSPR